MQRTVTVGKMDVCQGDIFREVEYTLDDDMTIEDFLRLVARDLLGGCLHYEWTVRGGTPCRVLGYIAHNRPKEMPEIKTPGDVCAFLTKMHNSKDLVWCCFPDSTLKDLNVTDAGCATS